VGQDCLCGVSAWQTKHNLLLMNTKAPPNGGAFCLGLVCGQSALIGTLNYNVSNAPWHIITVIVLSESPSVATKGDTMATHNKRLDPRVMRTRALLRQALVQLMRERKFEDITVKAITETATLNKATFYLHYRDKEDLLVRSTYELLATLEAELGDPSEEGGELTPDLLLALLTKASQHFEAHADYYAVILNRIGIPPVVASVQTPLEVLIRRWLAHTQRHTHPLIVDDDVVASFMAGGALALIRQWLDDNPRRPAVQVARDIQVIVVYGIYRAAGIQPYDDDD
jgi:AcrR family transcriptional regulator